MRNFLCIAALSALLAGCGLTPFLEQGIEEAKQAKETEAKVLLGGACASGRGATNRLFAGEPEKLAALDRLCDGPDPGEQAPTLDAAFVEALRAVLAVQQLPPPTQ